MQKKLPPPRKPESQLTGDELAEHVSRKIKQMLRTPTPATIAKRGGTPELSKPQKPKKLRAKGNPGQGGRQPGAGKPKGAKNKLGPHTYGLVKAIYELPGVRVPKDATPAERQAADEAMQRVLEVMRGRVTFPDSGGVLKSAMYVREEVCGPATRNINFKGEMTWAKAIEEAEAIDVTPVPTPKATLESGEEGEGEDGEDAKVISLRSVEEA